MPGTVQATKELYWQAVAGKNRAFDGVFVFAVKTTGIYCRPSCPAKTAHRKNVVFYAHAKAAQAAGYRACKRCQPNHPTHPADAHRLSVAQICTLLEKSTQPLPLGHLAAQVGLSPAYFHRMFKSVTGLTPKAYQQAVWQQRMGRTVAHAASVTEAIYDAGFNSPGPFYTSSAAALGMKPATYHKGGAGEHVVYAIEPCSLGFVLVAGTQKGLCMVELGDSAQALHAQIRTRLPQATLEGDHPTFKTWVAQTLACIENPQNTQVLPLDVQGTIFQFRVWQALQTIPAGSTKTYSEVAQQIKAPQAVRAVANACAANPIAVLVPCHRVLRTDGSLSGYRWGVLRKKELLEKERAFEPTVPLNHGVPGVAFPKKTNELK